MSTKAVVFSTGERTAELSVHCLEVLGLEVDLLESDSSFSAKMVQMAERYANSDAVVVRVDADLLCLPSLREAIPLVQESLQTLFFDSLMSRERGGTPHIYTGAALKKMLQTQERWYHCLKPEGEFLQKQGYELFNKVVALHDFWQHPSKVANTLLNRRRRGEFTKLYSLDHLRTFPEYDLAVNAALAADLGSAQSIVYQEFELEPLPPLEKHAAWSEVMQIARRMGYL